jgi:hypothetical protein
MCACVLCAHACACMLAHAHVGENVLILWGGSISYNNITRWNLGTNTTTSVMMMMTTYCY